MKLEVHGQPFVDYEVRKGRVNIRNPVSHRFVMLEGLTGKLILKDALLSHPERQKYHMRTDNILPLGTVVDISFTEQLPEGKDGFIDLLAYILTVHPEYHPEYLTPDVLESKLDEKSRPYYASVRENRGFFTALNRLYLHFPQSM